MKVTILAIGSRGDVQPYVALGLALQKSGAQVTLATFKNFEAFVTGFGLQFSQVRGDISRIMTTEVAKNARQADNPLKILLSFNEMKALTYSLQADFFAACQGAERIVYHPGPSIGYFIARQMGVPSALAAPFPMTPTRAYPALVAYNAPRLGPAFNLLSHKLFEQIFWVAAREPIQKFWMETFGRIPEDFGPPFGKQTTRSHPTVVSCSEHVFPRPSDWPEHVHNTGFWFLDDEPGWQPPAALTNFLASGPAPVYVGFGSVGDPQAAAATARLVAAALQRAGQRGIFASGWQGSADEPLPPHIFALESAPHAWLFPRMAAVAHHGGAGTTAAGMRAGIPAVIIPHGNDQFAWGRRARELGVAAEPIPRSKLSAENLAAAIQSVLKSEVREAANRLGEKIQTENGADTAAKIILDLPR